MEEEGEFSIEELSLADVSNSLAVRSLEQLQRDGSISEERAAYCRKRFEELHMALVEAMHNDKALLAEAKELNKRLQDERAEVERAQNEANTASNALELLREDSEQAESEAALCREREQMLQLEANELTRLRNEYQRHFDDIEREHAAAIAPQIRQLKADIQDLKDRIAEGVVKLDLARAELEDGKTKFEAITKECAQFVEDKEQQVQVLASLEGVPEKYRKQGDVVGNANKGLRQQEEKFLAKLRETEIELEKIGQKVRELTDEQSKGAANIERLQLLTENKDRAADDIRKELDMAGIDADQYVADQVQVNMQVNAAVAELKREQEDLVNRVKEKDMMLRKFKRIDQQMKQDEAQIPVMQLTRESVHHQLVVVEAEKRKLASSVEELQKEVASHMAAFSRQENLGKDAAAAVQASCQEIAALEKHVLKLAAEERTRSQQITDIGSQRERMSRICCLKVQQWKETLERVKMKDLVREDLVKKKADTQHRLKDFTKLYDLVKNQRNKFVTLIQASAQAIAEMKEKLKILAAEIEILHNDVAYKDRLLSKARADHAVSVLDREHLRAELAKCNVKFREKQDVVDEQITAMDKLSAIISTAEKDMLRLKKQYEAYVESRNYTGITLIDRNDELCILYEKANIQEEVAKQSEIELKKREDEIRMLRIELDEAQRTILVTRQRVPQIPEIQTLAEALKRQLAEARTEAVRLSELLERPDNEGRWRKLGGKVPLQRELMAKLGELEEMLSDRKEQMLEKDLILEEVTALSEKLRGQAVEGREGTLDLAKAVNDYQGRIRSITRHIMATVSELSMYQASALKLQQERDALADLVSTAAARMDAGQPPLEDAEREWERMERERALLAEMAEARKEEMAEEAKIAEANLRNKSTFSTAEQRPNAYIPEDLGIPKPYGGYAPFRPSEPGSTMRHIRKPEPKPIEI